MPPPPLPVTVRLPLVPAASAMFPGMVSMAPLGRSMPAPGPTLTGRTALSVTLPVACKVPPVMANAPLVLPRL